MFASVPQQIILHIPWRVCTWLQRSLHYNLDVCNYVLKLDCVFCKAIQCMVNSVLYSWKLAQRLGHKNDFSDGSSVWINEFPPLRLFFHYYFSQKRFPSLHFHLTSQGQVQVFYSHESFSVTLYPMISFFSPIEALALLLTWHVSLSVWRHILNDIFSCMYISR